MQKGPHLPLGLTKRSVLLGDTQFKQLALYQCFLAFLLFIIRIKHSWWPTPNREWLKAQGWHSCGVEDRIHPNHIQIKWFTIFFPITASRFRGITCKAHSLETPQPPSTETMAEGAVASSACEYLGKCATTGHQVGHNLDFCDTTNEARPSLYIYHFVCFFGF